MTDAIAVLDIGMTNKKVVLYSTELSMIAEKKRVFPPLMRDGLETHNLAAMEEWFLQVLQEYSREFAIKAIAVTTHGATFVCTDEKGNPVAPCIYYTHEPSREFHDRFFSLAGERKALQAMTGTPDFSALINAAKGIFSCKSDIPKNSLQRAGSCPTPNIGACGLPANPRPRHLHRLSHLFLRLA